MKRISILAVVIALVAFTGKDPITGKWQSPPSVKGTVTTVIYKPDGSFEGFINKKPFVSGTYSLAGDTVSFVDNGCNGTEAVYKVKFFSNEDSMRFEYIRDSCVGRKGGMEKLVLGKVK